MRLFAAGGIETTMFVKDNSTLRSPEKTTPRLSDFARVVATIISTADALDDVSSTGNRVPL
jgi:hypothetical protein